jgi:hypothetical protein
MTTRAFKPLAMHRSYKAENSAMETAGCVVLQAGSTPLPLATLAHVAVGELSEVRRREEALVSWRPACPARSPATPPVEGEAEWRGAWRAGRTAGLLRPPSPLGGGGQQVAGRESERRRGEPSSTRVSNRSCSSVGPWAFFFNFKETPSWIMQKNV